MRRTTPPCPAFILNTVPPSLIPSSVSLMSFLPSSLPSSFPLPGLMGLPASGHLLVTSILQTATPILIHVCTHTHALEHCVQPTRVVFQNSCSPQPPLFLGSAPPCPPGQTGLSSAGPGLPLRSCSSPFSATGFPAPLRGLNEVSPSV